MTSLQIAYIAAIIALWAVKSDRRVMVALTINLLATLAIVGLMDIGVLDRSGSTASIMVIDLATGAYLAMSGGLARLVALGYALTVPLYSLSLIFGIQEATTFAIVYIIVFAQVGVVCFDRFNGSGGGGRYRRGLDTNPHPLALSRGYSAVRATVDKNVSQRLGD